MWAVLGTTKIAEFMVDAIREAGDDVVSVFTRSNNDRLDNFAERFRIPNKFSSVKEALSAPGIRAVWIGTPNQAHAEGCVAALAHDDIEIILSEKSLERDMQGAFRIEQAVKDAKQSREKRGLNKAVIFREAIFYLNHPIMQKFQSFLSAGHLGDIKTINAEYSRDLSRLTNPDGGGAIFNLGVYPVSLLRLTLGTVFGDHADVFCKRRLRAFAHIQSDKGCREIKNQDYVARSTASIDFDNDIRATLTACEISQNNNKNSFEVIGTKGRVTFRTNPYFPQRGINQFDFIDVQGNVRSYSVHAPLSAYTYQILMTKHDLSMQREVAARPTATLSDSISIMDFLCEWERVAVVSKESQRGALSSLTINIPRGVA